MNYDAIIEVRLYKTEEGGRNTPIQGKFYSCPLFIDDNEAYDCRIILDQSTLELGNVYKLPIKFLNTELAKSHLKIGKQIFLWEGKKIASGKILEI